MKKFRLIGLVLIGILCLTAFAYAAIPRVINYQGRFTDKDDNPLSGNYIVIFRLYDALSEGALIWEEAHILNIASGVFNVLLGSIKPLEVDFNKDLWLGIEVASDGEMTPRIKLTSSAYALNAKAIDMINSTQLLRNDIDSVMSGSLTLKKDLILKGNPASPSRIVLTDGQGREYYLWVDNSGNLRIKEGLPTSDKDGSVILKEGSFATSRPFIQKVTFLIIVVAVLILGLIFYSTKKR